MVDLETQQVSASSAPIPSTPAPAPAPASAAPKDKVQRQESPPASGSATPVLNTAAAAKESEKEKKQENGAASPSPTHTPRTQTKHDSAPTSATPDLKSAADAVSRASTGGDGATGLEASVRAMEIEQPESEDEEENEDGDNVVRAAQGKVDDGEGKGQVKEVLPETSKTVPVVCLFSDHIQFNRADTVDGSLCRSGDGFIRGELRLGSTATGSLA